MTVHVSIISLTLVRAWYILLKVDVGREILTKIQQFYE